MFHSSPIDLETINSKFYPKIQRSFFLQMCLLTAIQIHVATFAQNFTKFLRQRDIREILGEKTVLLAGFMALIAQGTKVAH